MTEDHHPVDAALRKLAGDPQPTSLDRHMGEQRLGRVIESGSGGHGERRRKLVWAATLSMLAVVALYAALRPSRVEAAAEEIAAAAESLEPLTLPANSYLYTRAEVANLSLVPSEALEGVPYEKNQLVYLLPSVRETWIAADGTIQIRTQNQRPIFFTQEAEAAYYNAGLHQTDAIGDTVTEAFPPTESEENWPVEISALDEAIRSRMTDRGLSYTIEYLDVAIDILREDPITPVLRANTIRLIGQLPDLEVARPRSLQTSFETHYEEEEVLTQYAVTFDSQGNLVSEETTINDANPLLSLPPGTTISEAHYQTRRIVSSLESP